MSRLVRAVRAWVARAVRRPAPALCFHQHLERKLRAEDAITLRVSTVERSVAMQPNGLRAASNQE